MSKPIYVEIAADPVIPGRSGTGKGGQPYTIPSKQKAYFHTDARYPVEGEVVVPDSGPYRPGIYLLAGSCFKAAEYGVKFDDRSVHLVSMEDAVKALQAVKL